MNIVPPTSKCSDSFHKSYSLRIQLEQYLNVNDKYTCACISEYDIAAMISDGPDPG